MAVWVSSRPILLLESLRREHASSDTPRLPSHMLSFPFMLQYLRSRQLASRGQNCAQNTETDVSAGGVGEYSTYVDKDISRTSGGHMIFWLSQVFEKEDVLIMSSIAIFQPTNSLQ